VILPLGCILRFTRCVALYVALGGYVALRYALSDLPLPRYVPRCYRSTFHVYVTIATVDAYHVDAGTLYVTLMGSGTLRTLYTVSRYGDYVGDLRWFAHVAIC